MRSRSTDDTKDTKGTKGTKRVRILLNGEPFELSGPMTVTALLGTLEIDPRRVAVEHNLNVIKRGAYDATEVRDGDQIEIVNFVGGG
jgi:thiamine biosynthesis protein ThiS